MGTYKEIKGDLIALAKTGAFDVIAHGCNCYNTMGAGIAAQIRKEFPLAEQEDFKTWKNCDYTYNMLGTLSIAEYDDFNVVNCYTQHLPGPNLDYIALTMCFKKLNFLYKGKTIGLPQIGCGIGGGDWSIVKNLIQIHLIDVNVTIVIYKPNETKSKNKQN